MTHHRNVGEVDEQAGELWKHLRGFINGKTVDGISSSVTRKAYSQDAKELSVAGIVRLCVEELFWMAERESSMKQESAKQQMGTVSPDMGTDPDITKCPGCGGDADNGYDRCLPPNPYYCMKCTEAFQNTLAKQSGITQPTTPGVIERLVAARDKAAARGNKHWQVEVHTYNQAIAIIRETLPEEGNKEA